MGWNYQQMGWNHQHMIVLTAVDQLYMRLRLVDIMPGIVYEKDL